MDSNNQQPDDMILNTAQNISKTAGPDDLMPVNFISPADGEPFEVINPTGKSQVVLVCEHASNRIPKKLNDLGLSKDQLQTHVAWDPGALELAKALSHSLDAQVLSARFSRLVCDCNRPPEVASAMPSETDACSVPGNQTISASERATRAHEIYVPFHQQLDNLLAAKRAAGVEPIVITIHSFTPVFHGKRRNVELGFLHAQQRQMADDLLQFSSGRSGLSICLNQPYGPEDGVLHTLEKHCEPTRMRSVMIEVGSDLIASKEGVDNICSLLCGAISDTLSNHSFSQNS